MAFVGVFKREQSERVKKGKNGLFQQEGGVGKTKKKEANLKAWTGDTFEKHTSNKGPDNEKVQRRKGGIFVCLG